MMTRYSIDHDSRILYYDNHHKIDDIFNMDEGNRNLYDERRSRMLISSILYDDTPNLMKTGSCIMKIVTRMMKTMAL